MNLITWNLQWGRGGSDGRVDFKRIADDALAMADVDVLCFQEVARNYPGLPGSAGEDQFAALASLLPGFRCVEGVAVDNAAADGMRKQFGNAIYSRLPVVQVFRHSLPCPADPRVPSMQRVALEVVLQAKTQLLRVTTTHLEYYSRKQCSAQVERLRELHAEAAGHSGDTKQPAKNGGPFETTPRPKAGILTGDFNYKPDDALHSRLMAPFDDGTAPYSNAWALRHAGMPHDPTVGLYDREQWPEAFCCDFIYVSEDLAPRVRALSVNLKTQASDHQPVLLEIDI